MMNKYLTYRNLLYVAGFLVLLGYVVLLRSVSGVWEKYQYAEVVDKKAQAILQADETLARQMAELQELESTAASYRSSTLTLHNHLEFVEYLEAQCRKFKLRIIALPTENREQVQSYVLSEESISIEGNFSDILQLLYQIEHLDQVGSILEVGLERQKIRQYGKIKFLLIANVKLKRLNHPVQS